MSGRTFGVPPAADPYDRVVGESVVPTVESDLDVAHALADRAAVVAMSFFGSEDLVAETKDDLSPVTEADRAAEQLLRDCLAESRLDDAVVGEEFGSAGLSSRIWVLDPIDGTDFFVAGSPEWRIQMALEEDGELVVALVDMPAFGIRWWATRGGGTFERAADGSVRRLAVSTTSLLSDTVLTCYPEAVAERLPVEAELQTWRRLSLPEVIRGEIEAFYVDCCQVWDHAPWVLLIQEAGGRFTDHEGGRSPSKRGAAVLQRWRTRRAARGDQHSAFIGPLSSCLVLAAPEVREAVIQFADSSLNHGTSRGGGVERRRWGARRQSALLFAGDRWAPITAARAAR